MLLDSTNSFTCSLQAGAKLRFLMHLNNPAAADLGFRGYRPVDSLSSCRQGFASNHVNFERSKDSSFLTAVKSAYGICRGLASCPAIEAFKCLSYVIM